MSEETNPRTREYQARSPVRPRNGFHPRAIRIMTMASGLLK
jgi:hypothetical protein